MGLRSEIAADYKVIARSGRGMNWLVFITMFLRSFAFRVVFYYRIGHWLRIRRIRALAGIFDRIMESGGLSIATAAEIGEGVLIPHPFGIVIGSGVKIGQRAHILQGVTIGGEGGKTRENGQTQPHLGDDVLVGAGAKLLGPIRIGNHVKIGANAVVNTDLPDNCTAVGIPARIVKIGQERVNPPEQKEVD